MSTERLTDIPSSRLPEKSQSALSSADFYLRDIKMNGIPLVPTRSKRPILRNLHSRKVPLLDTGLVNLDDMKMYLHANPEYVPLQRRAGWKYHHVNHPLSSFEQTGLDSEDRDQELIRLRRSSYQQVHMRVTNERIYHNVHEIQVPHPPRETVVKTLADFERLDMLGATALFLRLSRGSSEYDVDNEAIVPMWMKEIEPRDRINFIEEVREEHASALVRTEVIPQRLVTSAIKRLSLHLKEDPYLVKLANKRLESDPVFYPLRVPSHKTLLDKAKRAIALEFMVTQEVSSLQSGVNRLELAA